MNMSLKWFVHAYSGVFAGGFECWERHFIEVKETLQFSCGRSVFKVLSAGLQWDVRMRF